MVNSINMITTELLDHIEYLAELVYNKSDFSLFYQQLVAFIDKYISFITSVQQSADQQNLDTTSINVVFAELEKAMSKGDLVMMMDVLLYEIKPIIQAFHTDNV